MAQALRTPVEGARPLQELDGTETISDDHEPEIDADRTPDSTEEHLRQANITESTPQDDTAITKTTETPADDDDEARTPPSPSRVELDTSMPNLSLSALPDIWPLGAASHLAENQTYVSLTADASETSLSTESGIPTVAGDDTLWQPDVALTRHETNDELPKDVAELALEATSPVSRSLPFLTETFDEGDQPQDGETHSDGTDTDNNDAPLPDMPTATNHPSTTATAPRIGVDGITETFLDAGDDGPQATSSPVKSDFGETRQAANHCSKDASSTATSTELGTSFDPATGVITIRTRPHCFLSDKHRIAFDEDGRPELLMTPRSSDINCVDMHEMLVGLRTRLTQPGVNPHALFFAPPLHPIAPPPTPSRATPL